jgi:hypothetical protein
LTHMCGEGRASCMFTNDIDFAIHCFCKRFLEKLLLWYFDTCRTITRRLFGNSLKDS